MKIKDLKQKNRKELNELLAEKRKSLRDLRFQVLSDQHKKVTDIAETKKTIARILTILNNKTKSENEKVLAKENKDN